MKKYVFGGYVITGGRFDNGDHWSGVAVMLGELPDGEDVPTFCRAVSGNVKNKELMQTLENLCPGAVVQAFFGMPNAAGKVKLESIQPVE